MSNKSPTVLGSVHKVYVTRSNFKELLAQRAYSEFFENSRLFKVGDILSIQEVDCDEAWQKTSDTPATGRLIIAEVTYMMMGSATGKERESLVSFKQLAIRTVLSDPQPLIMTVESIS